MATRTIDEKYHMFITAVKANQACKSERQNLSLLRSTPIGKYIEPEIAKDAAVSLVDCFQRLYNLPAEAEWRKTPLDCLKSGKNCEKQINEYVNHQ